MAEGKQLRQEYCKKDQQLGIVHWANRDNNCRIKMGQLWVLGGKRKLNKGNDAN